MDKKNNKNLNKEEKLTLNSYYDTIKNLPNLNETSVNDMLVFTNNEITRETAAKYINIMTELTEKISCLSTSNEDKEKFRSLFIMLFSKMCESDCKGLIVSDLAKRNKKFKQIINELQNEYQKERDEHNEIRKKYTEKEKEAKVDIPGINLSISLKNNKTLKPNECVDLLNELDIEDKVFDDKYKRLSVPSEFKNKVDRVYAKPSNSGYSIIQKSKK